VAATFLTPSPVQQLHAPFLDEAEVHLFVKRDDLIHPIVSGNKWRKLKYNIATARAQGKTGLLTFGGAYSNHLLATAEAGHALGLKTIGIVRGEEHLPLNPVLEYAQQMGMVFHYLDRTSYRNKHQAHILDGLAKRYGKDYLFVPEGGANCDALPGCAEIIGEAEQQATPNMDVWCTASGTGATLAGLAIGLKGKGHALGFSVLKGGFLTASVSQLLANCGQTATTNWAINDDYHFGGYAKATPELLAFVASFAEAFGFAIEPIYTGKMFFGLFDLIRKKHFPPDTRIMALHTGGTAMYEGLLG
jgi:1-aminocyclopropane-1-carboxylate deaminase